ncbi:MAG: Fe-S protein assembly co-chaperone HscB [Betaproteobacteria bacterium]|nr:Fe-S protein assembly co-chaperone HscB [Betaproteobacteria bacterium]
MKASSSATPTSRTSAAAARVSTSSGSSYFELFGLPAAFAVDAAALEEAYRGLQTLIHPDRHASSTDAERRASMQLTTRVNEAYGALRDPVQRAKHLLELHGVDVGFETNTQMPTDFLMQQLEVREELDGARARKDFAFLDGLKDRLKNQKQALEAQIGESIDTRKDYGAAADLVRKLMFLHRIGEEIDAAYD